VAHGFPSCAAHSEVIDSHRLKISTPHRTEGRSPHGSRPRTWWRASSSCSARARLRRYPLGAAGIRSGWLEFAGPAILNPPQALRAAWRERMAALAVAKPPLRGLRQGSAQWLKPELRVRVKHLKAMGVLRHATVRQLIMD